MDQQNEMKSKTAIHKFPEIYFIILAILAGYTPPLHFNPVFIAVAGILVAQFIFRNRASGLALGMIFFAVNLYFLGALFSEFREFNEMTPAAKQLLFGGLGIWILNMAASSLMISRYAFTKKENDSGRKIAAEAR